MVGNFASTSKIGTALAFALEPVFAALFGFWLAGDRLVPAPEQEAGDGEAQALDFVGGRSQDELEELAMPLDLSAHKGDFVVKGP